MKLVDFIVCDDIRTEVGNKHSLIGTYGDTIEFGSAPLDYGKWPKALKLGLYIRIYFDDEKEKAGIGKFRLAMTLNGNHRSIAEGPISPNQIANAKLVNFALVFNQFVFERSGDASFILEMLGPEGLLVQALAAPTKLKVVELRAPQPTRL